MPGPVQSSSVPALNSPASTRYPPRIVLRLPSAPDRSACHSRIWVLPGLRCLWRECLRRALVVPASPSARPASSASRHNNIQNPYTSSNSPARMNLHSPCSSACSIGTCHPCSQHYTYPPLPPAPPNFCCPPSIFSMPPRRFFAPFLFHFFTLLLSSCHALDEGGDRTCAIVTVATRLCLPIFHFPISALLPS